MRILVLAAASAIGLAAPGPEFDVGGLHIKLWPDTFTVRSLNVSTGGGDFTGANNFTFVPEHEPKPGCHGLGDVTLRVQPVDSASLRDWAFYSSVGGSAGDAAPVVNGSGSVLVANDLTPLMNASDQTVNPFFNEIPVRVVRSYEAAPDNHGFIMRINITNTLDSGALRIGAFGLSMPAVDAGAKTIEQSVWHDPHIGGDHGFVEWVRVVVDESTLLAVPHKDEDPEPQAHGLPGRLEAWRPIMENTCGGQTWEYTTLSEAWAAEWAEGKQYPYLYMSESLNNTGMWPEPKTPWPAWFAHDTVPVTDHSSSGFSQPWNEPTSHVLEAGETYSVAVRFILAKDGPRSRDHALARAKKARVQAVPGYVLSTEMDSAFLIVRPPAGMRLARQQSSNSSICEVGASVGLHNNGNGFKVPVEAKARGRCRVSLTFDDGTTNQVHLMILPAFDEQVARLGHHWATDSWLPRDYPDPFGRSASVMPYDRERREIVLDDSRAYDVGLSDDAGGGNPLGFAMKVGHAPLQDEVGRLDEFIRWTLYGVKPDTAKPPLKSLQIRYDEPGMEDKADGIRMTMYYYDHAGNPSGNSSGQFPYDYKMADHCGLHGIEGGPNWCMSESLANETDRVFNLPHHTASYYGMYRVARYHSNLITYQPWQWYLERAANTTLKFGSPGTGVMDGTIFREVLRSLQEEAAEDDRWKAAAEKIEANMLLRAEGFASQQYPYGSEYAFDTTGQEEVVVWLTHFADPSNNWDAAAKRTVDHILSYMRSSPTWAYHGGARSAGDLGNNGKWMVSSGTRSNFETRGNLHYRSGLNMIPLIEWYRAHPDDFHLLEVSMGALAGQLANIDELGAPSMMMHMLPHVLEFDPRSGDFGLGFFGHTLETGAYFVEHPVNGPLCFQCNLDQDENRRAVITPRDSYRQRVYLEPLGLYLQSDAGTIARVDWMQPSVDFAIVVYFVESPKGETFTTRRLRVDKVSTDRPGVDFEVVIDASRKASKVRGAFEIPGDVSSVTVTYNYTLPSSPSTSQEVETQTVLV